MRLFRFIKNLLKKYSPEDKRLIAAIKEIVGAKPFNMEVYRLALLHTSASVYSPDKDFRLSNERLEYLGDAILGAVVANYLYKKYPYKDEGFLTEIRARIVNRESLNHLSRRMGLANLVLFEGQRHGRSHKSMSGDALEAFVGAVFLDKGFYACQKFIIQKIVEPHLDIEKLVGTNTNFKSIIIEWAQRESKVLVFRIINEKGSSQYKEFSAQVLIDGEVISIGHGASKKKAEQAAAEKACTTLSLL